MPPSLTLRSKVPGPNKTRQVGSAYSTNILDRKTRNQNTDFVGLDLQNRDNSYPVNHAFEHSSKNTAEQHSEKKYPDKFLEKIEQGLKKAYPNIMRARGKHCVILIGNTGVGKSTLINALYSGIENIKEKEVQYENPFGEEIIKELIPREEIRDEKGNILFHVGAGLNSVTTCPEIAHQDDIAFCDCPGFGDTRGGIFDVVNCMAIGELFMGAESVQLCYLMTEAGVMNRSGSKRHIKDLLKTLSTLFNKEGEQEELITYDNLKKLRLIVTHSSGKYKKNELQSALFNIFKAEFKNINEKLVTEFLKKNLFFIDAKDRPSKFLEGEIVDKVADLKQQLVAMHEDMLYPPSVFTYPMTPQAKQEIEIILEGMKNRALAIFENNGTKEKIEKEILQPLKSLESYRLLKPLVKNYTALVHEVVRCIENKADFNQVVDTFQEVTESMKKDCQQQIESLKSEVQSLQNEDNSMINYEKYFSKFLVLS